MQALERSLEQDGWIGAITVAADGETFDGSARVEKTAENGMLDDPIVLDIDGTRPVILRRTDIPTATDPRAKRLGLAANRVASLNLEWEPGVLAELAGDVDLSALFYPDELAELAQPALPEAGEPTESEARKSLAERFGVPPFSVLDARQGYWQTRKRAWIALGIQSELGRGDNLQGLSDSNDDYRYNKNEFLAKIGRGPLAKSNASPGGSPLGAASLGKDGKTVRGDGRGRGLARSFGQDLMRGEGTNVLPGSRKAADQRSNLNHAPTLPEWAHGTGTQNMASGTSIFDPVLCELAYRWFCPEGGAILDPFAGGSVRGIVAAQLGRQYTGIDLRAEQIAANEQQAQTIGGQPRWIVGDSRNAAELAPGAYDLIFSCPPYADLEVYSDDPADLSTLEYSAFIEAYRAIIAACVGMLNENRFACFVVGDIRDKKGFYRNFVSDTIQAFEDAGALLYNEAILVTAVGSLPIRIAKQFEGYRKLGKTHQNVLVFYKGDPKRIKEFGAVEMGEGLAEQGGDGDSVDL